MSSEIKEYTALEDVLDIEVIDINNEETTVGKLIAQLDKEDLARLSDVVTTLIKNKKENRSKR